MSKLLRGFALFITPIAIPGWTIENIISRIKKREWRFDTYSAIPFFLFYSIISFLLLIQESLVVKILGLYIITAMQILSFTLSIAIIIGRDSDLLKIARLYGKREPKIVKTTFTMSGLVRGVFGFLFSIYFFSCLYYFIDSVYGDQFSGVIKEDLSISFFDFLYFSFATITTSNSTINPITNITKVITMIEVLVGLFYLVFLFGAFLSIHINKIYENTK